MTLLPRSSLQDLDALLDDHDHIIHCSGPEQAGKTALGLWWCRNAKVPIWVPMDGGITADNLKWAGLHDLLVVDPGVDNTSTVIRTILETDADLVVLDGVAAGWGDDVNPRGQIAGMAADIRDACQDRRILLLDQIRSKMRWGLSTPAGLSGPLLRIIDAQLNLRTAETIYRAGLPIGVRILWTLYRRNQVHEGSWALRWQPGMKFGTGLRPSRMKAQPCSN